MLGLDQDGVTIAAIASRVRGDTTAPQCTLTYNHLAPNVVAVVSNGTGPELHPVAAGVASITADCAADGYYLAAAQLDAGMTFKSSPALVWTTAPRKQIVALEPDFAISATVSAPRDYRRTDLHATYDTGSGIATIVTDAGATFTPRV